MSRDISGKSWVNTEYIGAAQQARVNITIDSPENKLDQRNRPVPNQPSGGNMMI